MSKTLYLLDGMALIYRAHFAFMNRPIRTSAGFNTSAIYGFVNALLDIRDNRKPTHLAVAWDTSAPTPRHELYPAYKAQREAMPEELSLALPHAKRFLEAFRVPGIERDGYEADDLIGTLAQRAERDGFEVYMVTPDKDFGQLVSEHIRIYKPGRQGDAAEVLGVEEICAKWGVERPEQVIDILGLWGDASDNIPGVPGIGEKTAKTLIQKFGSIEELIERSGELKGKQREKVEEHAAQARLSRQLAVILVDAPVELEWQAFEVEEPDAEALKALCVEFEFNAIGRRLFGKDFQAGRGATTGEPSLFDPVPEKAAPEGAGGQEAVAGATLKNLDDTPHDYQLAGTLAEAGELAKQLAGLPAFCFDTETTGLDPRQCRLVGISFAWEPGRAWYVPVPVAKDEAQTWLELFRPVFKHAGILKIGHNLKFDLSVLKCQGVEVRGELFDTMLAHSLTEPDLRHGMDYLAESLLGYSPVPISSLIGDRSGEQLPMDEVPLEKLAEYAAEDADVTWQLVDRVKPMLQERKQERVFYEIEAPLIPVLVDMEHEGVRVDAGVLREFGKVLARRIGEDEREIQELAGGPFNVNSPKQLGEVLFDRLKLVEKPKKTRTGQYATNEQTLQTLAAKHEIVRKILDYRMVTKLKSTYVDTLPGAVNPVTGRVHTTYNQAVTTTGRLQSQHPNLQNIPIRTDLGQEIRRAFLARDEEHVLLSADYSQIELRILAALSGDRGMLEAFANGEDIHAATAARVYGMMPGLVSPEMRRMAKTVNFGIAYGISAFGLSQRLGIPRKEAASLIEEYWKQFPDVRKYLDGTITFAKENGFVETVTGRRRYLRDINSGNGTIRGAAERNAINAPIQGTAADMIKLAMVSIHHALRERGLRSRMLLQVHDELVFDLHREEADVVKPLVRDLMRDALQLDVPIVVEMGEGQNWLEAH